MRLSTEAQEILDNYLRQVRLSLHGVCRVVPEDVERDVLEHIEFEFDGHPGPVSAGELMAVIDRLGKPRQWIPEEEMPFWRKAMSRFNNQANWRLAYLSIASTLLGLAMAGIVPPIGLILLGGGYLIARTAIEICEAEGEPLGDRRWLIYPSILAVVLPIFIVLIIGPLLPLSEWAYEQGYFRRLDDGISGEYLPLITIIIRILISGTAIGLWWILVGFLAGIFHHPLRWVFKPFADHFEPSKALWIGLPGLFMTLLSLTLLFVV
jgi:hypothetical protein